LQILKQNQSTIKGRGQLIFKYIKFETRFTISYKTHHIVLQIPPIAVNHLLYNYGQFEGTLTDGSHISCSKIALNNFNNEKSIFSFLEDLIIGKESTFDRFEASLIGAYMGNATFNYNALNIQIAEHNKKEDLLQFCNQFGNVLEGSKLSIQNANNSKEIEIIELSKHICLMFSLISGSMIRYNRSQFFYGKKVVKTIWRIQPEAPNHSTQCVNLFEFGHVLNVLLIHFNKLTPEEQKCYYTVIEYLNSTSARYLEDCILNIAQAWEIIAEQYNPNKIQLSPDIQKLKIKLKQTIKDWKKENSIDYNTDFISNRLINSLNWDAAIKKIENLAHAEKLDFTKLAVDIKKLIDIRNSIVHTGRFKVIGEEDKTLQILNSSVLALQVLILSKLGYQDELITKKNGVVHLEKIQHYKVV
jgi:hypothetical protein